VSNDNKWVVMHGEHCYGPFEGGQAAVDFLNRFQSRDRGRVMPLTAPRSYASIVGVLQDGLVEDPSIPRGEAQLRDGEGRLLGRITGIK
jgi:hypothetical protein